MMYEVMGWRWAPPGEEPNLKTGPTEWRGDSFRAALERVAGDERWQAVWKGEDCQLWKGPLGPPLSLKRGFWWVCWRPDGQPEILPLTPEELKTAREILWGAMKTVSIKIGERLWQRFRTQAASEGRTVQSLLAEVIETSLQERGREHG